MQLKELYTLFLKHPHITTDSRNCKPGSLFFALKGESFNGNKFANKALEAGCSYAIIDESEYNNSPEHILVPDVLETLTLLANLHRKKLNKPVIAITGTNGKTTTKELIATTLSVKYNVCATQGNFNNHIGVPLTLLGATAQHDILIIEMGANHMGEIAKLCEIAEPDYGLITNIGKAHLEGFGSYENIIKTKGELYEYIRKKNGKIFINQEDPTLHSISTGINKIEYTNKNTFQLNILKQDPYLQLKYSDKDLSKTLSTQFIGAYNLINFKAAICIGQHFKVNTELFLNKLEQYQPKNNRSQLTKTTKNSIIQDAYNANPSSVALAIQNFKTLKHDAKLVILGDMKELGDFATVEHQKIVDSLENSPELAIILIGLEFEKTQTSTKIKKFTTVEEAKKHLTLHAPINHLILLKGSRSMKMEELIEYL